MLLELVNDIETTQLLRPLGDIKMENARDMYDEFVAYYRDGITEVVVDFSLVNFIDSSGVGILLRCAEFLKGKEATLFLFGLSRQVETVFKLAGLLKIFPVLSAEEAENRFGNLFEE